MRVTNNAVTVLGGAGYMRDYAVERHLRDSRITTIYEGTTQIQIASCIRPITGGVAMELVDELLGGMRTEGQPDLAGALSEGKKSLEDAIAFATRHPERDYVDVHARRIVDMACHLIIGALLFRQGEAKASKRPVAGRWIGTKLREMRTLRDMVLSGDRAVVEEFDAFMGESPSALRSDDAP
jgi:hypothetical protein